jgi:Cof subfamily protein (haloacid dehalogenase superfamily)
MGYRLICIDMDGTLLNSRKQISEKTKASLLKAHERGVRIVLSTGRIYADAEYYAELIGIRAAIISANGAYIRDKEQHTLIYQSLLSEKSALKILDVCNRYHVAPNLYTSDREYYGSVFLIMRWKLFYLAKRIKRNKKGIARKYVRGHRQWKKVIEKERDHTVKCVVIHFNQEKISKIRNELARMTELEISSSGADNIELNCKGISKGKGVELVADYYHLKKEEIIAIGDNENDLSMIEYAGLGVAMGNASDIVKDRADYITDTNDNDGVAKVIDKFVLNQRAD